MSRIRLQTGLCRAFPACLAALWLGGGGATGAEKVAPRPLFPDQEVRSVLPESETKKKADSKKIDRLAPDSPLNGVADLPLFMPPSQQQQRRGPLSREQLEEIDKRKNWIFLDAKSAGHSADKMLGVREEKTYEDEREYKDLMQQHLEKGNASVDSGKKSDPDTKAEAKAQNDADAKAEAKTANGDSFFILPGDNARYGLKGDSTEARAFGAKPAAGAGSSLIPGGAPPSTGSFGGLSAPSSEFGRSSSYLPEAALNPQKTASQKEWAAEFKQLLDGKPVSGGFGRGGDPAGWFNDPSRQSLNPVIGVRPDSYSRPSAVPATTGFTLPSRPTGFDTFNRTPSLSDNGSSVFGAPGVSSPSLVPQVAPPSAMPRAGAFQELPKRKF
jgi:hypothetical protein